MGTHVKGAVQRRHGGSVPAPDVCVEATSVLPMNATIREVLFGRAACGVCWLGDSRLQPCATLVSAIPHARGCVILTDWERTTKVASRDVTAAVSHALMSSLKLAASCQRMKDWFRVSFQLLSWGV